MKLILIVVLLIGIAVLLLSVRLIFGREKRFLRGHACGFQGRERAAKRAAHEKPCR